MEEIDGERVNLKELEAGFPGLRLLPAERELVHIKAWQLPVRLTHWLLVIAIGTLVITGYLIGTPGFSRPVEPSQIYSFGFVRYLHLLAAYLLAFVFIIRLYWGFVKNPGNKYARWSYMLPWKRSRWILMFRELKELLWPVEFACCPGHAPIANLSYIILYLLILFQGLTGFALHAAAHYGGAWMTLFGWVITLFGGSLQLVRFAHHITMWVIILFVVIHLYLVLFTTVSTKTTEIDTMVSGYKYVCTDELLRGE